MRKSEMSIQQLKDLNFILEFLQNNGWVYEGSSDWIENDLWVEPEIDMFYENNSFEILIEYYFEKNLFTMILTELESSKEIIFDIFPENNIQELIKFVSENQNIITINNIQNIILQILNICPKIFTYKNGKAYRLKK